MSQFTADGFDINIDPVAPDSDNWLTIQQQSFTIDKKQYILDQFNESFPNYTANSYDEVKDTCNTSKYLRKWYAKTSLLFAQSIQLPVFLKDIISAPDYVGIADQLQEHNKIIAQQSSDIQVLSAKFDDDRLAIERKYAQQLKVITSNKIIRILTTSVEDLPILLQLEITRFKPVEDTSAPTRNAYARELLVNYQRTLIRLVLDNDDIDIDHIIEQMRSK